jgi:hypothetical protein
VEVVTNENEQVEMCSACLAGQNTQEPMPATGDVTMPTCGHVLSVCTSCTGLLTQLQQHEALELVMLSAAAGSPAEPRMMLCGACRELSPIIALEVIERKASA